MTIMLTYNIIKILIYQLGSGAAYIKHTNKNIYQLKKAGICINYAKE